MLSTSAQLLRRDLLLAMRRRSDALMPLAFFLVVTSLFPLAIGPDSKLLRSVAPGIVWVAALLASLLGLQRLFADDHADGSLEQLLLAGQPLELLVLAKVLAHWLTSGVPLLVLAPLVALQYGLDATALTVLWLGLLLGTPVLSLLGSIGAALALGARGGSVLVALILMPLYIPLLILGSSAVVAAGDGTGSAPHLMLLGALLAASLAATPWATAAALRIAHE
ncbi:heme exporter protein CcmB [Pseudoduganella sp. DS3]|uniref:Heme exporter protein B n=1 Tax=Pseudoduganella guangdongensis TaxID=2692179 RepID=A0A6N9HLE2_9BURK|nr:heme exporter protein CcmB [Pseudoduganella guangdongensis]